MNGVIYTRVSSDEQVDGTSLASQDELCREYCKKKGIEVVQAFREEGQSAKDLSLKNRSQFLAALEFCRKRKDIEAFVVFKVDRFARSTEDHFAVRRILRGYGATLYSVTEPIGDKPAEKFIETVLAGAAEYDNAIRKERCTGGMAARISQGIWPFRAPMGYVCAHHHKRGEKKTVPDDPHPVLFPIIQRGLRAYASGEIVSQAVLTRQLNLWGFATESGKPARQQLVNKMLTIHLSFYAGKLTNPWTREEHLGIHTPMISQADYEHIRARRLGKSKATPIRRTRFNPSFPLRRVLKCSSCGRFLDGAPSFGNGGRYGYYFCRYKDCALRHKGLRADHIQPLFMKYMRAFALQPGERDEIKRRVSLILESRGGRARSDQEARAKRVAALAEQRRRICEMREDGTYDSALFRERLAAVDQDIDSLRYQEETPPDLSTVDAEELTASVNWLLRRVALWWEKVPTTSRPRFEKILFPDGIRFNHQADFRTTEPGPILAIFGHNSDQKSLKVKLRGFTANQLYTYFEEVIALYRETKDLTSEHADVDSAA
jgi:DNA invertase Pin-like site-specific DNA recombinase